MTIKNSIALVTGANRGIGKALVEALLEHGSRRVYATARSSGALAALQQLDPERVCALELDVTRPDQLEAARDRARDITLLINNAGVLAPGSVLQMDAEAIRGNMDVNFYGVYHAARLFAPVIEANGGGAVVNLLTLVAMASMPGIGAYNASKAAAWSLTQSMRADLALRGVQVLGVFPGAVDTDMIRGFQMAKTPASEVAAAILAGIERGEEDIFPDPMAKQVYANWKSDHKAVERQFAAL